MENLVMILISAGHHKNAQGAEFNGITEFHLAGAWANQIVQILGDKAVRVPNGTLRDKVDFINTSIIKSEYKEKHIAIEIHFNSAKKWIDANANGVIDDGEMVNIGRGSETLYYPGSKTGKAAAEIVQGAIAQIMKPDRGVKPGWYQMNPAKGADFFLAKTRCVSLIVEPEFIDNLDIITNNMISTCHAIAGALLDI